MSGVRPRVRSDGCQEAGDGEAREDAAAEREESEPRGAQQALEIMLISIRNPSEINEKSMKAGAFEVFFGLKSISSSPE